MAKTRSIGSRLKELREDLGLTQAEFATRFDVSARTAQSYERDEAPPSALFLRKLADNNVDLNELLTGRPYRRPSSQGAGTFTTIVTAHNKSAQQPGELDIEALQPVLRSAIEEAQSAKDIDWNRTAQRFAAMYARHFGEIRSRR